MGKIIAIANQKGGVGKTTTTVNLGALLASMGKKIIIIDADPQGNATSSLGIPKELKLSLYNILIEDAQVIDVLKPTKIEGLYICPSNINLAGAEVELVSLMSRETRLREKLDEIKKYFDYILIDCPPSLGLITINTLTAADSVIIPIQCEFFALEGVAQLINTIDLVKKHLNRGLKLEGAVLTMYDSRTKLSADVTKEVKKHFEGNVFNTIIPRNIKLSEAPSFGMTILEYDNTSKGGQAYKELADEIIRRSEVKEEKLDEKIGE